MQLHACDSATAFLPTYPVSVWDFFGQTPSDGLFFSLLIVFVRASGRVYACMHETEGILFLSNTPMDIKDYARCVCVCVCGGSFAPIAGISAMSSSASPGPGAALRWSAIS